MILEHLLESKALQIMENTPFWYTSGDFGPYYINTHWLCNGKTESETILQGIQGLINSHLPSVIDTGLCNQFKEAYDKKGIYKKVIDDIADLIPSSIEYISGGERRDWFFSIMVAKLTGKTHVYLFKDQTLHPFIEKKKVLHMSDLVNTASSYFNCWVPTLEQYGNTMEGTITIVSRSEKALNSLPHPIALTSINPQYLIKNAELSNLQKENLQSFDASPKDFMDEYLKLNPNFLKDSLNSSNPKVASNALKHAQKYNRTVSW